MSNTIEVEPGEHAHFVTVKGDAIATTTAELSNLRDDYTALGESLTGANVCVMELESQLADANKALAASGERLRDAEQSLAIERRNVMLLNDQLSAARSENSDLHAALSKARQGVANKYAPYHLLGTAGEANCPTCNRSVDLLCPSTFALMEQMPAFCICWHCKTAGQIAVGPVKRVKSEEAQPQ